ncbi:hypothetical protein [Streptomyces scabiei]|uniref:hypothetical protein n=1 Tax=Streptomyces scabiei TaxID=1930 RepID=UPI0029A3A33C|nr:hypothetical protein [Streptomyces scabiei]MDX3033926.1 hypothetical protein [Streptomyces scabiei]
MALLYLAAAWYAAGAVMAARTLWRERRHLPAAPDNQPPTDLWTCRRIGALPTASRKENPQR